MASAIVLLLVGGGSAKTIADNLPTQLSMAPAQSLYAVQCATCHGADLQGGQFGPSLTNAGFAARWRGKRAELLKFVSNNMPPGSGGVLSDPEYQSLVDLILRSDAAILAGAPAKPAQPDVAGGAVTPSAAPNTFLDTIFRDESARKAALVAHVSPVTAAMLQTPPDGDWLTWRRSDYSTGYSPLKAINAENVAGLRLKWAWSLKVGRNEIAPLVHDGVMFVNSASDVEALDAADGTFLWRYRREIPPQYRGPLNMVQRSMAIYGRRLYVATADRHLVALDIGSGNVVWDTEIIPQSMPQAILSAGPLVADGILVEGTSLGPGCTGGCFITGVNANSGHVVWRFNTVARPHTPGGDSWNGASAEARTGASVWTTGSYDPDRDTIYVGTGNTYDISLLLKPLAPGQSANALFTDSTLALRPETGELRWYHQHFPREVWDLDEAFERMLVTLPVNGRPRAMVVSIGKLGVLDALDRDTGAYLFSINLGLNDIVKSIDPRTGRRNIDPAKIPAANRAVEVCPSVNGARNWMATAYNPASRILYVPLQDVCMNFTWDYVAGAPDTKMNMGWTIEPHPGSDGRYGLLEAVDMMTRKPLWVNRTRAVPISSLLSTAGGLVFGGSSDRSFRAYDDKTGRILWETRLNSTPNSTPVTFIAGGKQLIAVVVGGGGSHEVLAEQMTPEITPSAPSTTIMVFGL